MEAYGVVSRCLTGAGLDTQSSSSSSKLLFSSSDVLRFPKSRVSCVRWRNVCGVSNSGFSDNAHLQYYVSPKAGLKEKVKEKQQPKKVSEKESLKKKLKLLKGMSKDLLRFSSMGFQQDGLIGEINGMKITEATEILLSQLKQLKAEEKELKRKMKQEKAKLKAAGGAQSSSSSSSSESSDSESGEVVDMTSLRTSGTIADTIKAIEPQQIEFETPMSSPILSSIAAEEMISNSSSPEIRTSGSGEISVSLGEKKIEVCTGSKCKKSGALALMKEFQERLGGVDAVVGCKCMGKCREAPNVRVVTHGNGDDAVQTSNPLCLGVGLEDVGIIVSNFFGEGRKNLGLMV